MISKLYSTSTYPIAHFRVFRGTDLTAIFEVGGAIAFLRRTAGLPDLNGGRIFLTTLCFAVGAKGLRIAAFRVCVCRVADFPFAMPGLAGVEGETVAFRLATLWT